MENADRGTRYYPNGTACELDYCRVTSQENKTQHNAEWFLEHNISNPCLPCDAGYHAVEVILPGFNHDIAECRACPNGKLQWQAEKTNCVDCNVPGVDCSKRGEISMKKGYWRPDVSVAIDNFSYTEDNLLLSISRTLRTLHVLGNRPEG